MRILFALGAGIALTALALAASPAVGRESPACVGEARHDRLQGLTPQGDLILASGRLARLADIRLPEPSSHRESAFAWLRARMERPVLVQGTESRDRWDRVSVRIRLTGDSNALDLGHGLVEAGLAMVDPGLAETFCQPELLAFEETARERRLGLWADDRYKPINVEDMDRLRDRIGSFVLVEGRIRSIGERKKQTYLNFGGHWAEDFTIIIPRKAWQRMTDHGLDAAALKGRRIRVRGILQPWQGSALTVVIPDMIERLESRRLAR